jgi:anti-sigma B factor antagonist
MTSFGIAATVHGPQCDMTVTGELDLGAVADLKSVASRSLMEADVQYLVVDLAGVTFIDCAGLGALVAARNMSAEVDKEIALCNVPERVRRTLALTELEDAFTVHPYGAMLECMV